MSQMVPFLPCTRCYHIGLNCHCPSVSELSGSSESHSTASAMGIQARLLGSELRAGQGLQMEPRLLRLARTRMPKNTKRTRSH